MRYGGHIQSTIQCTNIIAHALLTNFESNGFVKVAEYHVLFLVH